MKTAKIVLCLAAACIWMGGEGWPLLRKGLKLLLEDRKTVATLVSPDRRHAAAVVIIWGSSGAASTWCDMSVLVKTMAQPGVRSWGYHGGDGELAYRGACDFDPDHRPESVTWTSPAQLRIAFDPAIANQSGYADLADNVASGAVRIVYTTRIGRYPF